MRVKGTGVRTASNPETEPDFYSMTPVRELSGEEASEIQATNELLADVEDLDDELAEELLPKKRPLPFEPRPLPPTCNDKALSELGGSVVWTSGGSRFFIESPAPSLSAMFSSPIESPAPSLSVMFSSPGDTEAVTKRQRSSDKTSRSTAIPSITDEDLVKFLADVDLEEMHFASV